MVYYYLLPKVIGLLMSSLRSRLPLAALSRASSVENHLRSHRVIVFAFTFENLMRGKKYLFGISVLKAPIFAPRVIDGNSRIFRARNNYSVR